MLRLAFERRGDATILRRCRYTLPLQVLSPLTLEDGSCYLLLLNPTGGVLGGDRLRTEIALEESARVCLSTPSATRVYRTNSAPAEIDTILRVGRNATLEYFPDHLIPHAGSSLRQTLRVEMDQGSRGIFFDGFASGRVALNEQWLFRDFDSRTEILLRGRPVHLARTRIFPASSTPGHGPLTPDGPLFSSLPPSALGRTGGYDYCSSLIIIAEDFPDWLPLLAALRSELDVIPGIFGGASLFCHSGCSARFLARSAIALRDATQRLWAAARRHLLRLPPLALRKY